MSKIGPGHEDVAVAGTDDQVKVPPQERQPGERLPRMFDPLQRLAVDRRAGRRKFQNRSRLRDPSHGLAIEAGLADVAGAAGAGEDVCQLTMPPGTLMKTKRSERPALQNRCLEVQVRQVRDEDRQKSARRPRGRVGSD